MANIFETIDSLKDEIAPEVKEQLKTAATALDRENKKLYTRAKQAEGFELKDGKWLKVEKPVTTPKPAKPEAQQSDEPDYGKLAYLKSEGVSHPDDRKVVMDESERLSLSIEKVLAMEHIKSKLKDSKSQREAEAGMPEGGGGKSGGAKNTVEHWVDKKDKDGNYVTPDDLELANKVIDARVKQATVGSMFSPDLHN